MAYIMVEDLLVWGMFGTLVLLGMYSLLSIWAARSYNFSAIKAKIRNLDLGYRLDKRGVWSFPVLERSPEGVIAKNKKNGSQNYRITDCSLYLAPQGIKTFLLMEKVGVTQQSPVVQAVTNLERLGFKDLTGADKQYERNLLELANRVGFFNNLEEKEISARYTQLIGSGERILNEGGLSGDEYTQSLATIHRWTATEFDSTFNDQITQREVIKIKKEMLNGINVQKLAAYVVLAVVAMGGIAIAYTMIQNSGGQMPNIQIPNPMPMT